MWLCFLSKGTNMEDYLLWFFYFIFLFILKSISELEDKALNLIYVA